MTMDINSNPIYSTLEWHLPRYPVRVILSELYDKFRAPLLELLFGKIQTERTFRRYFGPAEQKHLSLLIWSKAVEYRDILDREALFSSHSENYKIIITFNVLPKAILVRPYVFSWFASS